MADGIDGGIDLRTLSDDQIKHMMKGGVIAPPATSAPTTAAPQAAGDGGIDIRTLSDGQIQAMMAGQAIPAPDETVGSAEAAARLFYKHLTFGTQPFADRERTKQAAKEHPYIDVASAVPAFVAQTAVIGPAATLAKGVQGAGMLARGARALGTAAEVGLMPNTAAKGVVETARTGAKLGGNYSALEAFGSGITDPNKSFGETARDTAISYGLGTVAGGGIGAVAHGASRVVGAAANRTLPQLRQALEAAQSPEAQGIRDILKHAGWDRADLAALKANLDKAATDPVMAARYEGLNLLEALKVGRLRTAPNGELLPEIITTRNLDDLAKHAANTEGEGANRAAQAFGARKQELPAMVQRDVDRYFTGKAGPTVQDLPAAVDKSFGSGNKAVDDAIIAARKEAFNKRYDAIKSKPLQQIDEITRVAQEVPEFQAALNYAAKNDMIRLTGKPGAEWSKAWSTGDLGKTIQTLSPNNILDIHHALVLNAKPPISGPTPESVMAGNLKNWFSTWVDKTFKGHEALRSEYALFKRQLTAQELGAKMPLVGGAQDNASIKFYSDTLRRYEETAQRLARETQKYDAAMQRYQAGQIKQPPKATNLNRLIKVADGYNDVLSSFRKSWGESLKTEINSSPSPEGILKRALTPEGERRITQMLGQKEGKEFMDTLLAMDARLKGGALPPALGGDAEMAAFRRAVQEGRADAVESFRKAWGESINKAIASSPQGPKAIIDRLLTQAGKERILEILGQKEGTLFIEALYTKQLQAKLGNTLYGGSDTAFKTQKRESLDAMSRMATGLMHMRPSEVWKGAGDMLSNAYRQRNADRINEIMSQQGVPAVSNLLNSALATQSLSSTAHPFVRNPLLRGVNGPVGVFDATKDRKP